MWQQQTITLAAKKMGFHLITDEIEQALATMPKVKVGQVTLFIQHTSASLTINENCDPSVRVDLEAFCRKLAPFNAPYYTHTYEGEDDMPAHIKASLFGNSVTIPISGGRLNLGTWQGIYLGEHRHHGGARKVVLTLMGSD